MKILMVDDVKLSIEMGKLALMDAGCQIIEASNGSVAWELVKKEEPHMVLTDLFMPEMNGDELCTRIKGSQDYSHIPVIIITSVDDKNNVDRCLAAGCDDIIKKPYIKGDLINLVNRHINIVCRKHERYPVDLEVIYNFEGRICSGNVVDISEGGMFVKGNEGMPVGALTEFSLATKSGSSNLEVKGKVVRAVPANGDFSFDNIPGMGIEFNDDLPQIEKVID